MSFLESPKSQFPGIASAIAAAVPTQGSHILKPGCVQCGSLLEMADPQSKNFSGKCFSCEYCVSDGDEEFDDWED